MAILCSKGSILIRSSGTHLPSRVNNVSQYTVRFTLLDTNENVVGSLSLSIGERVEFLALAIGNLKSNSSGDNHSVQLLAETEEKLEVAQVQVMIWSFLLELPKNSMRDEAERGLNSQLYPITQVCQKHFTAQWQELTRIRCCNSFTLTLLNLFNYTNACS